MKPFSIENSALVVVDVQGKLANMMYERSLLFHHIQVMVQAAQLLDIPVLCLEQYPQGLGKTVEEISRYFNDVQVFEKTAFSGCGSTEFVDNLSFINRKQLIICGIEAHVCVYQTARDLLNMGYQVGLNEQAISARLNSNKKLGLMRMNQLGAQIYSTEMILFEWLIDAKHPVFRQVSSLLK